MKFFKFFNFNKSRSKDKYGQISSSWLLEKYNLDVNYTYFIFQASFGDKWCILSYLNQFLLLYQNVRILCTDLDTEIIRIFIGKYCFDKKFIIIDRVTIDELSTLVTPISEYSSQIWIDLHQLTQTPAVNLSGLQSGLIRHLHIVKYPYFSDLHLIHGVSYGTLLKMLLYLPSESQSNTPKFYNSLDHETVSELVAVTPITVYSKRILFNIVNISHIPLEFDQIQRIINTLNSKGFFILVNITQHPKRGDILSRFCNSSSYKLIDVPGHLLALVSQSVDGVVGVMGGAMNVAVQFSNSHCLSIQTPGIGFTSKSNKIFGGKFSENIWKSVDIDWPCFFSGRILRGIDIVNLDKISECELYECVDKFADEILASSYIKD